jgi:hypothetical protein
MLGLADSTDQAAQAAKRADEAWQKLNDDMFGAHDAALSVMEANLRQADAWARLRDEVKEHGKQLASNTDVGRANRGMIYDLLQGILDIRDANIRNKMAVSEANRLYAAQVEQLKKNLIQMGFNEAQIEDIIGDLARIPRYINTTITVKEVRSGELIPKGGSRALGGPVSAGVLYQVNDEQGTKRTEYFRPDVSGQVIPLSQMHQPSAAARAVSDARPFVANVNGYPAFQALYDEFVRETQRRGGTLAVIGVRS